MARGSPKTCTGSLLRSSFNNTNLGYSPLQRNRLTSVGTQTTPHHSPEATPFDDAHLLDAAETIGEAIERAMLGHTLQYLMQHDIS